MLTIPNGNLELTYLRKLSLLTSLGVVLLTQEQPVIVHDLPPGRRNLNWGRRMGWRVSNLSLELGAVGHTHHYFSSFFFVFFPIFSKSSIFSYVLCFILLLFCVLAPPNGAIVKLRDCLGS